MTKIEITAAMVDRALKAGDLMWSQELVRTMLDAALNPPPEPEITVTRKMSIAGARAYNEYLMVNHQPVKPEEMAFVGGVAAAYRAMRALEPKPSQPITESQNRTAGRCMTTNGLGELVSIHRRVADQHFVCHRRAGDQK